MTSAHYRDIFSDLGSHGCVGVANHMHAHTYSKQFMLFFCFFKKDFGKHKSFLWGH